MEILILQVSIYIIYVFIKSINIVKYPFYVILVPYISDVLFRLLRSLVKAYQLGETTCLGIIESDFTPHLTSEQRHLLAVLINTLT